MVCVRVCGIFVPCVPFKVIGRCFKQALLSLPLPWRCLCFLLIFLFALQTSYNGKAGLRACGWPIVPLPMQYTTCHTCALLCDIRPFACADHFGQAILAYQLGISTAAQGHLECEKPVLCGTSVLGLRCGWSFWSFSEKSSFLQPFACHQLAVH